MFQVFRQHANARVPAKADDGSAGYDLCSVQDYVIAGKSQAMIDTGLCFAMPADCYGRIAPRSGLAAKYGIDVMAGVVDSSYRGVVKVILYNHGDDVFFVKTGDRVAQLIFERIYTPELEVVEDFDALGITKRGKGGFGSSGR